MKKYITERALVQRINRSLAPQKQALKKQRDSSRHIGETGKFYIFDFRSNKIRATEVDIETLGTKLALLKSHEKLIGEKISKTTFKKIAKQNELLKQYYALRKEMKLTGIEIPPEADDILDL